MSTFTYGDEVLDAFVAKRCNDVVPQTKRRRIAMYLDDGTSEVLEPMIHDRVGISVPAPSCDECLNMTIGNDNNTNYQNTSALYDSVPSNATEGESPFDTTRELDNVKDSSRFNITVKKLSGQMYTINVAPTDRILDVATKIYELSGCQPYWQCYYLVHETPFSGEKNTKRLLDHHVLRDYSIHEGTVLHLLPLLTTSIPKSGNSYLG